MTTLALSVLHQSRKKWKKTYGSLECSRCLFHLEFSSTAIESFVHAMLRLPWIMGCSHSYCPFTLDCVRDVFIQLLLSCKFLVVRKLHGTQLSSYLWVTFNIILYLSLPVSPWLYFPSTSPLDHLENVKGKSEQITRNASFRKHLHWTMQLQDHGQ